MAKRIIISGISDSRNNGCWAMATVAMVELRKKYPNVSFIYLTNHSSADAVRLAAPDVTFLYTPWTKVDIPKIRLVYAYLCFLLLFINTFLIRKFQLNIFFRNFCTALSTSDYLIDLGGDSVSTDYPDYGVLFHMLPPLLMKNLGKPYYFLAQSIGPLKGGLIYKIVRFVLAHAKLITIREAITAQYLDNAGIKRNVLLTADLAFLLVPIKCEELDQLKDKIGLNKNGRYVGVSVSDLISRYMKMDQKEAREKYIGQMAAVCDHVIDKYGYDVLFIPHVMIPGNDDRIISREVRAKMSFSGRAVIVEEELNASQMKGLIGCSSLFVGSRMHAAIGAISQGVPTIIVAYNHKAYGIFKDMLGQGEFIVDIDCFADGMLEVELSSLIAKLCSVASRVRQNALNKVALIRGLSEKNFSSLVG